MKAESPWLCLLECCSENLWKQVRRWTYVNVSAPYWRLYWNDRPGAFIQHAGKRIALTPDRLFLVPPNTVFSTVNSKPVQQLYLHFLLLTPRLYTDASIITLPMSPSLRILIKELLAMLEHNDSSGWHLPAIAHALVALVLSKTIMTDDGILSLDPRILRVTAYMQEHLGETLTNRDLARQGGFSEEALVRLFKAQTGHTPGKYLQLKRIEQAGLLLRFSNDSIKQISEATGFCDRNYFSRIFKRVYNIGPGKFRNLHYRYIRK